MTPAAILASIPDNLIRRHREPTYQLETAKALADWLHDRGHCPSLAEIEEERARRAPTNHREANRHRGRTTKEK